jgi:hypothetical protein
MRKRKLKFRTTPVVEPMTQVEARFVIGDVVHALDTGDVGRVEFVRRDAMICVQWGTGSREWLPQDQLCGPLVT